jgi:hypothetical protein
MEHGAAAVFGSVRPPLGSGEQVAEDPSGARIPGGGADAPPAPGLAKETYGPTSRTGADAPSAASVFGSVRAPLGSAGGAAVGAAGASVFGSVRPVFGSLNPPLGSAGGAGEARSTEVVSMGSGARSAFGFGSVRPPLGGGGGGQKSEEDAPPVRGLAGLARELSGNVVAPASVFGSVRAPLGSSGVTGQLGSAGPASGAGFGFGSVRPPLGGGSDGVAPEEAASSPTSSPASEVGFTSVRPPISTSGCGNARLDAARPPHIHTPEQSERPIMKVGVCVCGCVCVC